MTELKPCPFCGEQPEIISNENDAILIRCSTLACVAWKHRVSIDQWNTRQPSLDTKVKLEPLDEEEVIKIIKECHPVLHHPITVNWATTAKAICQRFGKQSVGLLKWPEEKPRNHVCAGTYAGGFNEALELCKQAFEEWESGG